MKSQKFDTLNLNFAVIKLLKNNFQIHSDQQTQRVILEIQHQKGAVT